MAFVEDLDQFLSTNEFAIAATYNGAASVLGIFDNGFFAIGSGPALEGSMPSFLCKVSDVPSAAHGDTLLISSQSYVVSSVHPDGTGIVILGLRKES